MKKADQFTIAWERFFLIAGNIVFFAVLCILLATGDKVHRNAANWRLFLVNILILAVLCAGSLLSRWGERTLVTNASAARSFFCPSGEEGPWRQMLWLYGRLLPRRGRKPPWKHSVAVLAGIYMLLFLLQCILFLCGSILLFR